MYTNNHIRGRALVSAVFIVALGICTSLQASVHIWIGAPNGVWSAAGNWSGGLPPSNGEVGGTIVQFGSNTSSSNDVAGLVIDQIHFTGSGNTITGTQALGISGSTLIVNIQDDAGGNTIAAALSLVFSGASCEAAVNTGTLTIASNMSGTVGFVIAGPGTVTVTSLNNTYSGATTVLAGTLQLNSNAVNTAVPHNLTIGDGVGAAGTAVVKLLQSVEIADTAIVTVNSDGLFDLNSFGETVATLTVNSGSVTLGTATLSTAVNMTGGSITGTGTGRINLTGNITATSNASAGAAMTCNVSLNLPRTFTVNSGAIQPELTITGVISDGGGSSGIFKAGTGTLNLLGVASNTYTGTTTVDKGVVQMNTSTGNIVPGPLIIGNGVDAANSAILRELQSSDISPTSAVTINASGMLDMNNGQIDTVGGLSGSGAISLGTNGSLAVNSDNSSTSFAGSISGQGQFSKAGTGTLTLTGDSTFTGTLTVRAGTLALNSNGINTAVPTNLTIGTGLGAANSCVVRLMQGSEIANTVNVIVKKDGLLDLNNFSETIGALTVNDGNATLGSGTLSLGSTLTMSGGAISATTGIFVFGGDITATSSATSGASISSKVFLNATRTIAVNTGPTQPDLTINGVISDGSAAGSGITKSGVGTLLMSGSASNTYTGATTVDKGVLTLNFSVGFGIPAALVIGNAVDAANSAIVRELQNNDIFSMSAVTINASGLFDLNNFLDTFGSLTGSGSINLGSQQLRVGNDNSSTTFSGLISGTGTLTKIGTGTLTLTNNNSYTGSTSVQGGTLLINGSQAGSAVNVTGGATLGGTGTIGTTSIVGSKLFPGSAGAGQLSTGNLSLDATSTLIIDLVTPATGGFGSLNVTGTVTLGGCGLTFNVDPNFGVTAGTPLSIIANDGTDAVSGILSSFAEGATINAGVLPLKLSYAGGTGNDVTLTGINVAPAVTSQAMAVPSPAGVGQTVIFTAAASDGNHDTLTYMWNFGDGSDGNGASVMHAYQAAGTYNVGLTITDGQGGSTNSNTSITVNAPLVGQGADSDGDGFSDGFETTLGTDPNSAADTPTGQPATPGAIKPLTVVKASIKLNFAGGGKDSISFSGTLAIPAAFNPAGAKLQIDVGGITKSLTLSSKGAAKTLTEAAKVSIKATKGAVLAQTAKYLISFKKGTFAASLGDEGLVGDADVKAKSVTVPFTIIFNNEILQKGQTMSFSAKKGKTGSAK